MRLGTYPGRAANEILRELAPAAGVVIERVADVLSETRASVREWLRFTGRTDVSLAHVEDWELVSAAPVNVWLRGSQRATRAALTTIRPSLTKPVVTLRAGASLDFLRRSSSIGTLILEDASALSLDDQRRLLAWLHTAAGTRVISSTSSPILPLIKAGVYLDSLYYRLNTVYVEMATTGVSAESPSN